MTPLEHQIAQRNEQTMFCPKCAVPLKVVPLEKGEVDQCERCQGVWVSVMDEKLVLHITPEVFTIDELRRLRALYQPFWRPQDTRYVPCPECRQLMNRKIWGSHSGVLVDACFKHGTWFDAGEVEKIREYVKLGGIEYEKLRMTENGLSELDSKLEREVNRLDRRFYACRNSRIFDAFFNPRKF
jgi:Zn-finger nucleic acid-binding protein